MYGQLVHVDESMVAGLLPAPPPFLISFLLCQMVLLSILGSVRRGSVGPPALGSHAALFPLGLGGAFCSRSRFQLPFEEEEKKGKERREWSGVENYIYNRPISLLRRVSPCLPANSHSLQMTSLPTTAFTPTHDCAAAAMHSGSEWGARNFVPSHDLNGFSFRKEIP